MEPAVWIALGAAFMGLVPLLALAARKRREAKRQAGPDIGRDADGFPVAPIFSTDTADGRDFIAGAASDCDPGDPDDGRCDDNGADDGWSDSGGGDSGGGDGGGGDGGGGGGD